jgi:colanic acid biosynthesis glycosyl transferase WcaI
MAVYLSKQGHAVQVVTTPPYYPYWQVQSGYRWWAYRKETWNEIEIYRCPLWVPKQPSGLKRILHLLSFALSSLPIVLTRWRWHPDIIICIAPALFSAPVAFLASRLSKSHAWLHIQDFELDAAFELGLLAANHRIKSLAYNLECWLYNRFERVSTISPRMIEKLLEKGLPQDKIYWLPNWVDTDDIYPLQPDSPNPLRQELGLPNDKIIVLYAGNIGEKQGLDILVETSRILRTNEKILFVICGEGAARRELVELAIGLDNIRFYPLQPVEKLNQLLNLADIHVLPQRADVADLVMPSKLTGMLASGKAVIATAWPGTGVADIVSEVGLVVPPEQPDLLSETILELVNDPQKRILLGYKGREYIQNNWAAQSILEDFNQALSELMLN